MESEGGCEGVAPASPVEQRLQVAPLALLSRCRVDHRRQQTPAPVWSGGGPVAVGAS